MINSHSDPSGVLQHFSELRLKIYCCRYWKLSIWNLENMVSPFWRLYHNVLEGACVLFNHKTYRLSEGVVLLIPPNTAFSTRFASKEIRTNKDILEGSRITTADDIIKLEEQKRFDHFFIHFNLGFQYDSIKPSIYRFEIDPDVLNQLEIIKNSLVSEYEYINLNVTATIQSLLLRFVALIPQSDVVIENYDSRVVKILNYIDRNFHMNLSNRDLSNLVAMSPNSFLRLFKARTGQPLHGYLQKKRIEEAITQIHHTDKSIDEIASSCGFCDRYHFSKVFKKQMNISPAYYRKQLTMK